MIMGITWTNLESVWNPSGCSEVLQRSPTPKTSNWSGTIFCCFLQKIGSRKMVAEIYDATEEIATQTTRL